MPLIFIEYKVISDNITSKQYSISKINIKNFEQIKKLINKNSPPEFKTTNDFKIIVLDFKEISLDELSLYRTVFNFKDNNFDTLSNFNVIKYFKSLQLETEITELINYIFDNEKIIAISDLHDLYEFYDENEILHISDKAYNYQDLLKYRNFLLDWKDYVNYQYALLEVIDYKIYDKNLNQIIEEYLNMNPYCALEDDDSIKFYFLNPKNKIWIPFLEKLSRKKIQKHEKEYSSKFVSKFMNKYKVNFLYMIYKPK
jgi:hypothetical protein